MTSDTSKIPMCIDNTAICYYGCGGKAVYTLKSHNGEVHPCCSPRYQSCVAQKIKRSQLVLAAYDRKHRAGIKTLKNRESLEGIRFGKLVAICPSRKNKTKEWLWKVKCDCGVEREIRRSCLINGNTKSCGCLNKERWHSGSAEMVGKKFGRLTVIRPAKSYRGRSGTFARWDCRCDCGKETTARGVFLRQGRTRSCGCGAQIAASRGYLPGEALKNQVLARYRIDAIRRNIQWTITDEYFFKLTQGLCYFCGEPPSQILKKKGYRGEFIYNEVDRLNSSDEYTASNCVPCCKFCNWMKRDTPLKEFFTRIQRIIIRHPNGILHPFDSPTASQGRIAITKFP